MGKRIIYTSDLPDTKGNYNEVADPDELQKVFVGVGGSVYQVDVTEGEAQAFLKAVQKYVDAAKNADADDDPKVFADSFETKQGFRRSHVGVARSATASTGPKLTGAQLAGKVDGLTWTAEAVGQPWATSDVKADAPVPAETKGFKDFVIAMGEDPGTSRISNDSYWSAIETAQGKGFISKPAA